MKVGDLITRKTDRSRLYNDATPPLRTVMRVIKSNEPRLHGFPAFYVVLDDDPGAWRNPNEYFIVSKA
tara:strand:- start:1846 stop:2049 length:204 start_codon:yes stop_codon:yes gene_type:complete